MFDSNRPQPPPVLRRGPPEFGPSAAAGTSRIPGLAGEFRVSGTGRSSAATAPSVKNGSSLTTRSFDLPSWTAISRTCPGAIPQARRGVAQGGNLRVPAFIRGASCPRDARWVIRNSLAPSAPLAGHRGARRRGRPHRELPRQRGAMFDARKGADWPKHFRTRKIPGESRR